MVEVNHIWLFLPMFNEQSAATESIRFFAQLALAAPSSLVVKVIVVTTERETELCAGENVRSTRAIAQNIALEINGQIGETLVLHEHYPDPLGWKPHQLNWAIGRRIEAEPSMLPERTMIAVYDVDARPDSQTLDALSRMIDSNGCGPEVAQQLSAYFPTRGRDPHHTLWGAMASLWQTRFTFAIERSMIESSRSSHSRRLLWSVANGFFLRLDTWSRIGGFTEIYHTEDIELGYRLSSLGISITLVSPLLETGNPSDFASDVKQKFRWFGGLFDYVRYPSTCRSGSRLLHAWLMSQGVGRAILWVVCGPVLVLSWLAPAIFGSSVETWMVAAAAYLLPVGLVSMTLIAIASVPSCSRAKDAVLRVPVILAVPILAPLYAVSYGFGPMLYVLAAAVRKRS
ncbi:glycosyltransferase [Agrobacterium tumefaciens]|uniref:glycosyltransferase family 2 protein n=1 Tax=Agrobacterium tumefaciens TaxID=358 RepID=UPI00157232AC|nr:glycosyltransferase [Agrobacterium tumefaciens]